MHEALEEREGGGRAVDKMLNRRGNKNKDKPPPDPHREFLDAESTDEEDRSKIYEKNIKLLLPLLPRFSSSSFILYALRLLLRFLCIFFSLLLVLFFLIIIIIIMDESLETR